MAASCNARTAPLCSSAPQAEVKAAQAAAAAARSEADAAAESIRAQAAAEVQAKVVSLPSCGGAIPIAYSKILSHIMWLQAWVRTVRVLLAMLLPRGPAENNM